MEARRTLVVADPMGLHARPAARIARAAGKFGCNVTVAHGGQVADAKSIVELLGLFAPGGAALEVRAVGEDAAACADAVERALASQA